MNSAEPRRIPSHNIFWRKLRRRYSLHPYFVSLVFFAAMPTVCLLAWLSGAAGLRWLVTLTGTLWFIRNLGMLLPSLLFLASRSRRAEQTLPPTIRLTQSLMTVGILGEIAALLMGRIDLAAGILYGMNTLRTLFWQGQRKAKITRRQLFSILMEIGIIGALTLHAYAVAALLIVAEAVKPALFSDKQGLLERATTLPTRAAYVARVREQCAAGGG